MWRTSVYGDDVEIGYQNPYFSTVSTYICLANELSFPFPLKHWTASMT